MIELKQPDYEHECGCYRRTTTGQWGGVAIEESVCKKHLASLWDRLKITVNKRASPVATPSEYVATPSDYKKDHST